MSGNFEALVESYGNYGYSVAMGILDNWEDSNDAYQNALIKAWTNFHTLKDISKFNSWFSQIVRNCSYDILRYKISRKAVSLNVMEEDDKEEYIEQYSQLVNDPELDKMMSDRCDADLMIKMMDNLPRMQGSIVKCRYVIELSIKETSEVLGIKEGTVKSESHRGLALLREWSEAHV